MKRRTFLNHISSGLLGFAAGVTLQKFVLAPEVAPDDENSRIDENGNIYYKDENMPDGYFTAKQFHEYLLETYSHENISTLDENIITLQHPYHITEDAARLIRGGSLVQGSGNDLRIYGQYGWAMLK